ncbi:MAG: flagellin [Oscillospiraceae bacterium]|nr:flagellin [Oscillospiraceae bacterium]
MRIQHNIMAMNAYRNYTNNVSAMKKNLEKLSSGYKINRAGDDAAGLAISEKMRAQITGLETAQKNAKDGISLVQTAEGALTEVHDMLNRMVELATQSANGTYDNTTDRYQLQKEVDQLRDEINRIADSSNFNGIKLLDGSMEAGKTEVTWQGSVNETGVTPTLDGQLVTKDPTPGKYSIDFGKLTFTNNSTAAETLTFNLTDEVCFTISIAAGKTLDGQDLINAIKTALDNSANQTDGAGAAVTIAANDGKIQIDGITYNISAEGSKITLEMDSAPTKDVTTNFTASFDTTNFSSVNLNGTGVEQVQVTPEVEAVPTSGRVYGQAKLELDDTLTQDGNAIQIGDETYVFARKASTLEKFADSKAHVIDLTDIKKTGAWTDTELAKVAARVAAAAKDNARFKVGANVGEDGTLTFTEKEGGVDYNVNNLAGADGKGTINGASTTADAAASDWKGLIKTGTAALGAAPKGTALTLQIGDTADDFNQLKVSIGDIHTKALGIDAISIADQTSAAKAIDAIKAAINQVSDIRGTLGATQNRLDHTINNLSVMTENIQDAESTIRDTDVASEMMAYTKNNILIQSAQAMLAQANQVPQGVLQLLQ